MSTWDRWSRESAAGRKPYWFLEERKKQQNKLNSDSSNRRNTTTLFVKNGNNKRESVCRWAGLFFPLDTSPLVSAVWVSRLHVEQKALSKPEINSAWHCEACGDVHPAILRYQGKKIVIATVRNGNQVWNQIPLDCLHACLILLGAGLLQMCYDFKCCCTVHVCHRKWWVK